MKIGKAFAVSAASGILLGVLAGCGGGAAAGDPKTPSTDPAAAGAKASCSGTAAPAAGDGKASCSGKGSCSGKSESAPKTN